MVSEDRDEDKALLHVHSSILTMKFNLLEQYVFSLFIFGKKKL